MFLLLPLARAVYGALASFRGNQVLQELWRVVFRQSLTCGFAKAGTNAAAPRGCAGRGWGSWIREPDVARALVGIAAR